MNKKGQQDFEDILKIVLGILMGLFIAYFFLWGETYSELNKKYTELEENYQELNASYDSLQQECIQVLKSYEACIGREDFFTWIDRFFTLKNLAKLIGLI